MFIQMTLLFRNNRSRNVRDLDLLDICDVLQGGGFFQWLVARAHQFEAFLELNVKHRFIQSSLIRLVGFDEVHSFIVDFRVKLEEAHDCHRDHLLRLSLHSEHLICQLSILLVVLILQDCEALRFECVVKLLQEADLKGNGHSIQLDILFKI